MEWYMAALAAFVFLALSLIFLLIGLAFVGWLVWGG
jgi:hypothetical protein